MGEEEIETGNTSADGQPVQKPNAEDNAGQTISGAGEANTSTGKTVGANPDSNTESETGGMASVVGQSGQGTAGSGTAGTAGSGSTSTGNTEAGNAVASTVDAAGGNSNDKEVSVDDADYAVSSGDPLKENKFKLVMQPKSDKDTTVTEITPVGVSDVTKGDGITVNENTDATTEIEINLPRWGVHEFINDRTIWLQQMNQIGAEQGWFYFKIFFNFDSAYGLLSSLLHEDKTVNLSRNSAIFYLASIEDRYKMEKIPHRMLALYKFGALLRSIQTETPWLFKGVNGLDAVHGVNLQELGKDKTLELVLNTETMDNRLGTLFDLYKYACYDAINSKEIIPANLRKFDMSVLVYNQPLKYMQTAIKFNNKNAAFNVYKSKTTEDGMVDAKTTYPEGNNFTNMMSFKLYTFENCEFDTTTLNTYVPNSLSNEQAFNLGGNTIKINYYRAYEHRMNEYGRFMMGNTGFLYNEAMEDAFIGSGDLVGDGKGNRYEINATIDDKENQVNSNYFRYTAIENAFVSPLKNTLYDYTQLKIDSLRQESFYASSSGNQYQSTKDKIKNSLLS